MKTIAKDSRLQAASPDRGDRAETKGNSRKAPKKLSYFRREESLGYLLRSTERTFTKAFQARIEQEGMTIGMWYYLRALWVQDGVTQRELSQRVETMDPSTASALTKMERQGLIYRVADENDRRKRYIFLTDKAKKDRDRLLRPVMELQEFVTEDFSEEEEATLRRLLERLRDKLKHDRLTGTAWQAD